MKKKKENNNYSGIVVCDSITMSVRNKKQNRRGLEAFIIATTGFVSVIMSFLDMFRFRMDTFYVFGAAVLFAGLYAAVSLIGKHTFKIVAATLIPFAAGVYLKYPQLVKGFKAVYNVIYSDANHTEIKYYKFIKASQAREGTTLLFIFGIWLLALVIYTFTIARPNPIPIIIATFPIIEVGLYNGIHIPVLWGVLTIAFWLAVMAMCNIDMGEYSGGAAGFVRKENFFFPKRHMRLKVTERCALLIISSVLLVTGASLAAIKLTDYKRSDRLNQKRANIKNAVNSFSMDDIASSLTAITEAFGFTLDYENHKLGDTDRLSYRKVTDLKVTVDSEISGAIYLKGYNGARYSSNEWFELDESAYYKSRELFDDFNKYGMYPQSFPNSITKIGNGFTSDVTMWIENKRKKNRSYAPYGTNDHGDMSYKYDSLVISKKTGDQTYSYKFINAASYDAANLLDERRYISLNADLINSRQDDILEYCEAHELLDYTNDFSIETNLSNATTNINSLYYNGSAVLALLLEQDYRDFVYENYLQVPSSTDLDKVRNEFGDLIAEASLAATPFEKILCLYDMKQRMSSMAEYSLSPGKTPSNRDFVSYFLLENHKGYCTHYATAGVMLARMAGIPARYATGYIIVGDDFNSSTRNSDNSYTISVTDERSHAWAEIYLDGYGWVPFEFTAGYSEMSIDTDPPEPTEPPETEAVSQETKPADTDDENSTRPRRTRATNENTTSANQTVTTPTTTSASSGGIGSGSGNSNGIGGLHIPPVVFKIFLTAAVIGAVIGFILLRRRLMLNYRERRFSGGNGKKRITAMYDHTERLLRHLGIVKPPDTTYAQFAENTDRSISPKYAHSGDFTELTECALAARFGNTEPTAEQLRSARSLIGSLTEALYSTADPFKKMYLRFVLAIK